MIKNSSLSNSFSEICRSVRDRSDGQVNGLMRAAERAGQIACVSSNRRKPNPLSFGVVCDGAKWVFYDQSRVVPQENPVPELQGLFVL